MSSLLCTQGPLFGTRIPIRDELTFGRSTSTSISLVDLQVSRLHATVRLEGDRFVLIDGPSRNGTFVNGERLLEARVLEPGDEVQVGSSRFLFDAAEDVLPVRYGAAWVIVGGAPPGEGEAAEMPADRLEGVEDEALEDPRALRELLAARSDEEGLARSLLQWLLERAGADRGGVFTRRPEGGPVPLVLLPALPALSINRGLLEQVSAGATVTYAGPLEVVRFIHGRRTLEVRPLAVLAIPWRLGGELAGLAWLERDLDGVAGRGSAGRGAFDEVLAGRLRDLLKMAGSALENARRNRISRRRQRWENTRDDGERVPGRLVLERAGLYDQARELASSHRSVAVIGPRGMGRDRIARVLHALSPRWEGPLVRVLCTNMSEAQAQFELFGCERGTVPGMEEAVAGRLELADGGTLVLEQVEGLGNATQDMLLRALMLGRVVRLGGEQPSPIDVRVVCTSTRPLEELVREGGMRHELVSWLGEASLTVPGLEELKPHLLEFAMAIIGRLNVRQARCVRGLTASAERALLEREWPCNLWELEELLIRALSVVEGDLVSAEDLELAELAPSGRPWGGAELTGRRLSDALREVERRLLVQALRLTRGHLVETALLMDMPREALERKLIEYAIDPRRL